MLYRQREGLKMALVSDALDELHVLLDCTVKPFHFSDLDTTEGQAICSKMPVFSTRPDSLFFSRSIVLAINSIVFYSLRLLYSVVSVLHRPTMALFNKHNGTTHIQRLLRSLCISE